MSGLKAEEEPQLEGGARVLAPGWAGSGVGRVVGPVGGTEGRVGAGTWRGGAANTLCDRSRMDALIGARTVSSAGKVGRVATTAWILPNLVVMVSS